MPVVILKNTALSKLDHVQDVDCACSVALFRIFLLNYWHMCVLYHAPRLCFTPVVPMKRSVALYWQLSGSFRSFWVVSRYWTPSEKISRKMSIIIKWTHTTTSSPIFIANEAQQHLRKARFPRKLVIENSPRFSFSEVFFFRGTAFLTPILGGHIARGLGAGV